MGSPCLHPLDGDFIWKETILFQPWKRWSLWKIDHVAVFTKNSTRNVRNITYLAAESAAAGMKGCTTDYDRLSIGCTQPMIDHENRSRFLAEQWEGEGKIMALYTVIGTHWGVWLYSRLLGLCLSPGISSARQCLKIDVHDLLTSSHELDTPSPPPPPQPYLVWTTT